MLKERPELFIVDNNVYVWRNNFVNELLRITCSLYRRPGILVLVNDCDWELVGGIEYTVEDKDSLTFISTLHGG